MSEPGFTKPLEQIEPGLTFLKPLATAVPSFDPHGERSSVRRSGFSLMERLFPPRSLEDSGSAVPVTGLELGHFVLEEQIGRGGMGAVFRAIDSRLNRVVALKVLAPEHSADPEAVVRFQNEARAAARLDHDNIARVFYTGEQAGLHFIAFEFVSGTNIRNFILQRGRLSPADAVNYTLQVAEALRHTAAANVIHRDIKPSNIIVSPTGRAKLVDLGLARYLAQDVSKDLTVENTALGTFDYIAPEQALNARNVDIRADIYSLGCTLYHMLTGEPPYPKGTMFEKVMNHHRAEAPDPATKNPHVTPQLSRVVRKMMASNPDERYPSPESLIADLVRIAESMGLEPAFPETAVWTTPAYGRRLQRWEGARTWGAVALVLLMLAALAGRIGEVRRPLAVALGPSASTPSAEEAGAEPGIATAPSGNAAPTNAGEATGSNASLPAASRGIDHIVPPPFQERHEIEAGIRDSASLLQGLLREVPEPTGLVMAPSLPGTANPEKTSIVPDPTPPVVAPAETVPVEPRPPVETVAGSSDPFVIVPSDSEERIRMPTLAAACAAAPDNAIIEIHADGPLPLQQERIRIVNKRLRVRPAPDHRPTVRFDLASRLTTGSFSRIAEMIHVEQGALELYDLDLEMIVDPESVVDLWAMITLSGGSEFIARGVSFTLANSSQLPAALLNIPDREPATLESFMPERMMARKTSVLLSECVCRGGADFVLQRRLDNMEYRLDNVGFALSGTLFRIDGTDSFEGPMEADAAAVTNLRFAHVTAVTGEGLLRAAAGEHGVLPRMIIETSDSVFRVDHVASPLVAVAGHQDFDVLLESLTFRRSTDPSFFNGTPTFCSIESTSSLFADARELDPEELGGVGTRSISDNLLNLPIQVNLTLMHEIQPTDLMLRQESDFINPARDSSGDSLDAGVDWSLPRVPLTLPVIRGNGLSSR